MIKESAECDEEGTVQESLNEAETVQNRPTEDKSNGIQQRVECDEGKQVECNGKSLQERQQQEGTVQYRMIERDDSELVPKISFSLHCEVLSELLPPFVYYLVLKSLCQLLVVPQPSKGNV